MKSITDLDRKTERIADELVNEFMRLGVSVDDDPCSGLWREIPNVVTDICAIRIYDDHASGIYDGELLLDHLKTLEASQVSLRSGSTDNIWLAIQDYEI